MLIIGLLISFAPDTVTMAGHVQSDPGSGTADPEKTYYTDDKNRTHHLTSDPSNADIRYNTDTYINTGISDADGNPIVLSMEEVRDLNGEKDYNGADTVNGFKYNSVENTEYMTAEDIFNTLVAKYGGESPEEKDAGIAVGRQYLEYLAEGNTSYTYNTICAYDARISTADQVSNGRDEAGGRYSPTYSLDGYWSDDPEEKARAEKALEDFYGEANWKSNTQIKESAIYRQTLSMSKEQAKSLMPTDTPTPVPSGPVPTTGTPTPTSTGTPPPTSTPTDTPTPVPQVGVNYIANYPAGAVGTGGYMYGGRKDFSGTFTIQFCGFNCSNFHFITWKNGNTVYPPGSSVSLAANGNRDNILNLYAQWEPNPYIVTYDYNADFCVHPAELTKGPLGDSFVGGEEVNIYYSATEYLEYVTDPDDAIIYAGQHYPLPEPKMRGYNFINWSFLEMENGNGFWGIYCTPDTICEATENHFLYAVWDPCKYKVTLDYNFDYGRTPGVLGVDAFKGKVFEGEDFMVTFGEPYNLLPTPRRKGYVFKGWFTEEEGNNGTGTEILNTTRCDISNDHTLYAKWEPVTVTVSYGNVVGDEKRDPVRVTYDELFGEEMLYTPEREGWTFIGWNDDIRGEGTWLTPDMPSYFTIDTTIFAIFTPDDFVLTLDYNWMWKREAIDPKINDAAVTVAHNEDKVSVTFMDNYPDDLPVPSREGYVFKGWWLLNDDGSWARRITHLDLVEIPRNHTVKAYWLADTIIVELDYNNDGDSKYFSYDDPTLYHYYMINLE